MKQNFLRWMPVALSLLAVSCSVDDGIEDSGIPNGYYSGLADEGITPRPSAGGKFDSNDDNPFVSTADEPTSTFSVDADGASYAIMRRYMSDSYWQLDPKSVRIEEFLNYFTYDYAQPSDDNAIAINAEVGECPWNDSHRLLRLGIKGKELKADEVPLANYVFLIDVSGSMEGADRLELLKSGLTELLAHLQKDDRISIITYAGEVRKLLESTPVSEAPKIRKAIQQLSASGYTPGAAAMVMAYEEALTNFDPKKNNRIIMGTDGDFNVGVTSTEALVEMVESYAKKGIYLTCLGFGMGNLNDAMMEQISNHGNGTYHYIDSEEEMMKVFVHERERFVSVANDVKCQLTFNPDVIDSYRLIGYENRLLKNEDFADDKKDAAEIGAGQTITALYELVPAADSNADETLATFDCRYKTALGAESIPLQRVVSAGELYTQQARSQDFSLAAGIAAYGMLLRESPYKGDATYEMALKLVNESLDYDPHGYRARLLKLIEKAAVREK